MVMTLDKYQAILDQCGGEQQLLPQRQRWRMQQDWRHVFAAALHQATGRWKHDQFEWHVFSFEFAQAYCGERALAAYQAERARNLVVCPEFATLPAVRLVGATLPDFRRDHADVYIWPEDLNWTMAFTHEESLGLGPYYCRREWL